MDLHQMQCLHVQLVAKFIEWIFGNGYEVTWGETYRTPQQAALNAQAGIGIAASLHTERLAVDFMLFKDGLYLTDTASYAPLGAFWKTLDPLARWGGDFAKPDGDHFSLEFNGIQ